MIAVPIPARRLLPMSLLSLAATVLLLSGIACGGTAAPAGDAGSAPAADTPAPAQPAAAGSGVATAIPAATAAPAATEVMAPAEAEIEKFTVMVTTQGNELFNSKYAQGENNLWQRMAQVWLIGGNFTNGSLVLDESSGIASKWEIVDDGLAWEFTIRPGIRFHNGEELDVDDVAFMAN